MTDYKAPLQDIAFQLETVGGMAQWPSVPGFEEAGEDLVSAVLSEAGRLAGEVIAPTNAVGDAEGAVRDGDGVRTPDAFKAMHRAYVDGGWPTLAFDPDYGGQGLPGTLAMAVTEMVTSANMAYSLNPLLSSGAIEALSAHGTEDQKQTYLSRLISGEWSGTMNLTEPGAGSDVGALKTRAERADDGSYRITGQKIYITWGEHDLAENIVHLVLARLPDAPKGTKGISMFLVPKYLVNADGSPGARNDVRLVGLEHKLGIHASPTCTMAFGENGDCVGYLVGEENKGMRNMFTMMNHARVGVGLQGTAISERAYQAAVWYAKDRVQSAALGARTPEPVAIIRHPDVRRMLMTMRATTEATRAIIYRNAWAMDRAHRLTDPEARAAAQGEADLLTPLSKAYGTDVGVENTSLAIQVFGGMGYVEETGVAQHYRDARIAPIYEGTNGIQALDLVGRKLNMDGGAHWKALIDEMADFAGGLDRAMADQADGLVRAVETLRDTSETLFANGIERITDTGAAATPYLRLFATVLGGYLLARQAVEAERRLAAAEGDPAFLKAKLETARFYLGQILPPAVALAGPVKAGAGSLMALAPEDFERA
ncbi:acyl-CoA dehydrogenase [Yunchengibacter salinarum]|uniref:acyl-CoA dehydrogenase n=1 Tax=Yunchengibacter salinarum TaxID=3133399 RepID=UPI0035B628C7